VLVTTTNPAAVPAGPRIQVFGVGGFSPREALSYLMGRLTADPDQRLGAIDLVDDLGCEPLALSQASAVIASSELTCRSYRDLFARRRDQIESSSGGKPAAAAVTWTLSVEHADRLVPGGGAQPMLAVSAVLDRHGIPATVLTSAAACRYLGAALGEQPLPADRARRVLLGLERVGLLGVDSSCSPPVIRMSGDVQAAVRRAMPPGMAAQAAQAAVAALLEAWPAGEAGQPWVSGLLRSCVSALMPVAGEALLDGGIHPLLMRAGESLDRARLTTSAIGHWRRLTEVSERVLGSGHPDTLLAGGKLGQACLAAGQPAEAASWFRWLLDRQAGALGPGHPGTLASRASLGRALLASGQPAEAVTMLSAAVAGYEQAHGADHPDTLAARDELASAYRASGRLDDAAGLYRQILADRERVQGDRHPGSLSTRQNLADTYLADGRLKDAISQFKRVLGDRERVLGADHPDTIAARGSLAAASHAAGRMAPALRLYEQTSADCERVLGADHPGTLARRVSLAHAYYEVGRLTDAITLLRDTAARCDRVLSPTDPLLLTVRESLGNITGDQGPATAPR
jgi:tetratricopeptide (TPR) repeat protein